MAAVVDNAKAFVQENLALLRVKLDQIPALQDVENKLKVPKEYLVIAGTFLFVVLVFFGIGANTLCSFIGFMFPAYQTILAIEKKNKGDDTQWLVYWILYSFFSVIETFQDFILYWIPFYFAFKLAFLLWAMLPQTRGAKLLYDSFLKDFLKRSSNSMSRIDTAMQEAKKSADTTTSELVDNVADLSKKDE
ncbi:TB2_DP1_HVA22-domain-containing protein [Fragilariopsis cylindrus CCMP1102]|uniref:TB2_DP1_HVA22-domain-containing protein n=1 Tax=Fragilariopsis cylindrus CCMP1102 TaxID=635003 RepID=A0A1E7FBS7_9STRA|nr:TB2_DP1_HVA22-domain-containing protein [Fragilariopsis cylindrus CCMP1102]|eukprot:OEU15620.1 TB2_DP1_HVA22-domain-containing protein [Fragilariopsis cylindrus CCMP1102]